MQTFDDVKFISREVKLIYGKKTREKCFDTLYGESIENIGNRNTCPVVAKGSDDSVFTNFVVSAKTTTLRLRLLLLRKGLETTLDSGMDKVYRVLRGVG